jgi:hypothetical protein
LIASSGSQTTFNDSLKSLLMIISIVMEFFFLGEGEGDEGTASPFPCEKLEQRSA